MKFVFYFVDVGMVPSQRGNRMVATGEIGMGKEGGESKQTNHQPCIFMSDG